MIFCRGCGKEIHESAKSCPHCGATQNSPEIEKGEKSKYVAFILAFLLGPLGIHSFYLGKKVIGLVYLLLTVIPAIILGITQAIFWHNIWMTSPHMYNYEFFAYYPCNMPVYWWVFWGILAIVRLTSFIESIMYITMSDSKFKEKYG